ncbi:MAG TPA: EAL domain-containing protein [Arenimonas sp.]|nr:EAL domain-containing protein [Arenimonas sp.]
MLNLTHPRPDAGTSDYLDTLDARPDLLAGILHALDEHAIVAITDRGGRIVYANDKFCELSKYSRDELLGQDHRILNSGTHPRGFMRQMWSTIGHGHTWHGQFCNRAKDGSLYWVKSTIVPILGPEGRPSHYVSVRTDISAHMQQAATIERLAYYDELTGLPNRALLKLRLDEALAVARDASTSAALLCIDLDRFKEVNDSRGHSIGDSALGEVARRFRLRLDQAQTLARTGGDEFAVILPGAGRSEAEHAASELQHCLQAPVRSQGHRFSLDASIGIALFPDDGDSAEDLLRQADLAMYRAKSAGVGHCFYRKDMGAALIRQLDIAARLERALSEDRLQLHYQPLLCLRDQRLEAAEVLLRWQDPQEGWMSPAEFVAIAEARNMMPALGGWVFRRACRQLRAWRDAGLSPPLLAINLSAQQFSDPRLLSNLRAVLDDYGLPAASFELELTESSIVADPEIAVQQMNELAELGFSLAIDDFGTGYSSLSYLKRFPARKLKIDMSFVREMLVDRNDHAIVETIIAMARTLGLQTVAEGVESAEQAEALAQLGCDLAQGWHFAKALDADAFVRDWLRG